MTLLEARGSPRPFEGRFTASCSDNYFVSLVFSDTLCLADLYDTDFWFDQTIGDSFDPKKKNARYIYFRRLSKRGDSMQQKVAP